MVRPQVNEIGPLLRRRHGRRVRKLCLSLGATCPNRDGTVGRGGCAFCDAGPATPGPSVQEQLRCGRTRHRDRPPLIAYFQDHSATHLAPDVVDCALTEVEAVERIVGITIGTRPDCLPAAMIAVLERHAQRRPLTVELGLQSASDAVLRLANRCHDVSCFAAAVGKLQRSGVTVCAHVILGLPAPRPRRGLAPEDAEGAAATARLLGAVGVEAVKIHNCHVLVGTTLADVYSAGEFTPPNRELYLELLVAFLEHLPRHVEIHRMVGDARAPKLVAPDFTARKPQTLQWLRQQLARRGVVQGARAGATSRRPNGKKLRPEPVSPPPGS